MERETSAVVQTFDIKSVLFGLVLGLILGVLATLIFNSADASSSEQTVLETANDPAKAAQRWFVFDGSAPLTGRPFNSESECETARQRYVSESEQLTKQALSELPEITYRQIQALGYNPADRLIAKHEQVQRAYCRLGAD